MADEADRKPHYVGHRDRLRQRFLQDEEAKLPDYEILELLLFHAIPRRDVKPLAKALIDRFGSLGGVFSADPARLAEFPAVKDTTAALFRLVREAAKRMGREDLAGKPVLGSYDALVTYCRASMGYEETERFRVLFLNRKNMLIADEVQQKGTVDHTPVYPREVVKRALELGATALILVHNHPSGDTQPSRADVDMTKEIQQVAKSLGIVLHDHIVIGRAGYWSFREQNLL
ncbi:MAG: DNA repair protein RadC [Magnetospirillum sp. WYHS-4]